MRKLLALCALPLVAALIASPASAALIFKAKGSGTYYEAEGSFPAGPGKYRFVFGSSIAVTTQINAGYEEHWDTFLAPPPKPHEEYIEGNDYDHWFSYSHTGTQAIWDFVIPRTIYTYFGAPSYFEGAYGIPAGTPVYEETKFEEGWWNIYADDMVGGEQFDYYFTVTAVPEPGTWALMITGFGLAGLALRSRRRTAAA